MPVSGRRQRSYSHQQRQGTHSGAGRDVPSGHSFHSEFSSTTCLQRGLQREGVAAGQCVTCHTPSLLWLESQSEGNRHGMAEQEFESVSVKFGGRFRDKEVDLQARHIAYFMAPVPQPMPALF